MCYKQKGVLLCKTLLIGCLLLSTAGCDEATKQTMLGVLYEGEGATQTVQPMATASQEESPSAVGLAGSHYTDIVLNMEKFGIMEHSYVRAPEEARPFYSHSSDAFYENVELDAMLDYAMSIDENAQVISVNFGTQWMMTTQDNSLYTASTESYLGYAARMYYDSEEARAANAWVIESLDTVDEDNPATTTFGDATYELYGTRNNGQLTSAWLRISVTPE